MFDELSSVFNKEPFQQKSQLWSDFYNFKVNRNQDVMTNVATSQHIAFRLNRLQEKVTDTMIITRMIAALPEEYHYVSTAWDSSPSNQKTLENLKSILAAEEDKMKKQTEEKVALKPIKQKGKGCNKSGNKKFFKGVMCCKCKQEGHYQDHCQKNKQDQEKPLKKSYPGEGTYPVCGYCKKTNHEEEKCFFKNKYDNKNNNKVTYLTYQTEGENKYAMYSVKRNYTFVADTGATGHSVKDANILTSTAEIEGTEVRVAKKGQKLTSNLTGVVDSKEVTFSNVLYLPDESRNLLSINTVT